MLNSKEILSVNYLKSVTDLAKIFLQLEERHKLFDLQDSKGFHYWPVVRQYIYRNLLAEKGFYTTPHVKKKLPIKRMSQYGNLAYNILKNSLCSVFRKKRIQAVFVNTSRFLTQKEDPVDLNMQPLHDLFIGNSYHIECFLQAKDRGLKISRNRYFLYFTLFQKFRINKPRKEDFSIINDLIKSEFNVFINCEEIINNRLQIFRSEFRFAKRLVKALKPKFVFIAGYLREPLLTACKVELGDNVTTVEVQHGSITPGSVVYRLPPNVDSRNVPSAPDYYFIHAEYWKKWLEPQETVVTGSNLFFRSKIDYFKSNNIVIISGIFSHDILLPICKSIGVRFPNTKIYFKLHSSEEYLIGDTIEYFNTLGNVFVVFNERSLTDLFNESKYVIVTQSTCSYEAVQMGLELIILKKLYYMESEDLFALENVTLAENDVDIFKIIRDKYGSKTPLSSEVPKFFHPFQKQIVQQFINKHSSQND